MNKKEIVEIAKLITTAYPSASFPKEKLELWGEMLAPYDFETVKANTKRHILYSEYSPTIADLVKLQREEGTPLRNVSQRDLNDVKQAEKDAEEFLKNLGEL
jgi:Loader and inhibitor of phage G40P